MTISTFDKSGFHTSLFFFGKPRDALSSPTGKNDHSHILITFCYLLLCLPLVFTNFWKGGGQCEEN